LAVMIVVGYCVYSLASQQIGLNAVKRETEAARARVEQLRQLNKASVDEKNLLSTPAYVEKLAREELGLVRPGEVPYIPAGKN